MASADDGWIEDRPDLVRASARGDRVEVRALLDRGVPPDQSDDGGWSALHAAAARGHAAVVETLLTAGAEVDRRDDQGFTPLLNAASAGSGEVVGLLLAARADVNAREPRLGWTPLHRAADYGDQEILSLLIDAGARVDDIDAGGGTALMAAAESGSRSAVERLLSADADPTVTADEGTAADLARKHGHHDIAAMIDGNR